MDEKLKPCPFCGRPGKMLVLDVDLETRYQRREYGCPCLTVWTKNPEDWNRRAPGPATAKLLRCIKAQLEPTDRMIDAFLAEHEPAQPA